MLSASEPRQGMIAIRQARLEDIGQISGMFASAFYSDPVYEWFFPHASGRLDKLRRLFAVFLEGLVPLGTVFTTEGWEGASLWIPAGMSISNWQSIRQNLRILRVLGAGIPRSIRWWLSVESEQPRYPHWELFLIGVAPAFQGKGIGSALLRPGISKCNEEQLPIYLDTGNRKNVGFYQRYGFKVLKRVVLSKKLTVFQMVRNPQACL